MSEQSNDPQHDSKSVPVILCNGLKLYFSPSNTLSLLFSRETFTFYLTIIALYTLFDPGNMGPSISFSSRFLIWFLLGVLYLAFYVIGIYATLLLRAAIGEGVFFTPIALVVVSYLTTVSLERLQNILEFTPQTDFSDYSTRWPLHFIMLIIVELLAIRLLLPNFQKHETLASATAPAAKLNEITPEDSKHSEEIPVLRFSGEVIECHFIQAIQSEDHYCRIKTKDKEYFLRGRISDAIEQMPTALGMLIHRSHWIAYSNFKSFKR